MTVIKNVIGTSSINLMLKEHKSITYFSNSLLELSQIIDLNKIKDENILYFSSLDNKNKFILVVKEMDGE
jgi:hypothetical protein